MIFDFYVAKPSNGDVFTRLRLLVTETNRAEAIKKFVNVVHGEKQTDGQILPSKYDQFITSQMSQMQNLSLCPPPPDLSLLPPGSWFLQFAFKLANSWISKDDAPFYVAESVNPVRKDIVFKVPVMAASSWKGLLRWTLMHTRLALKRGTLTPERFAQERFVQTLLFGDEQGEKPGQVKGFAPYVDSLNQKARQEYERLLRRYVGVKDDEPLPHHSGRLFFYPTFFDRIDLEVINPHSRETRAGTKPIYLECVPAGAEGTFSLLYVPFDLIGESEEKILQQAAQDLEIVATGLQAMFLIYGFSAKRSSGYGVAKQKVKEGILKVNIEEPSSLRPPEPTTHPSAQVLPKYLIAPGKLKPEYLNPDGTFRERSEAELKAMKKSDRQEYEKAKKWWEREGKLLTEQPQVEPEAPSPVPETRSYLERTFSSFEELKQKADELADAFKAGGEQ